MHSHIRTLLCACLTLLLATTSLPLSAAPLYWDTSDSPPIQGGDGNWNTSAIYWNSAADGSSPRSTWISGSDAIFTNGTNIITLTESITANSISQTGGLTVIGGLHTLNLTSATGVNNTSNSVLSLSSDLTLDSANTLFTGTGLITLDGIISEINPGSGILKTGTNTLQLNNSSNLTGTITASNGTILINHNQALGSTSGQTITNGGTIALQNGITITGETISISGSGYTGGNNYAGTLQAASSSTATWAGTVNLTGTARIGANGPSSTLIIDGKITGNGTLEIGGSTGSTGGGTTIITGNHGNDFTGNVHIVRGTLKFQTNDNVLPSTAILVINSAGNDPAILDLNGTNQTVARLAAGNEAPDRNNIASIINTGATRSTFTTNQTAESDFYGSINGNINFHKLGIGTLNFFGPNTSIIDGDLVVENRLVIGRHEPTTDASTTILSVNSASFTTTHTTTSLYIRGNNFTSDSHTLIVGSGGLTLDGYNIYLNAGDAAGGRLVLQGDLTTLANTIASQIIDNTSHSNPQRGILDLDGGIRNFNVADGAASIDLQITASITNGGFNKTGTGTLRLTGDNTYDGTTTITSGTVHATSNTALGSSVGGTSVADGARLYLSNGITITGETLTIAGSGGDFYGAIQAAGGASATWAGDIILNSGARIGSANSSSQLTISGNIQNGTVNTLIIAGHGTHVLSSVSTYTGQTQILRGTLKLDGGNNRLPTGTTLNVDSGAAVEASYFDLNGYNQNIAGLLSSGATNPTTNTSFVRNTDTTQDATLTITNSSNHTYNGIIEGGTDLGQVNITKSGTATQTLAAINTYTGKTTVNNGTLSISATGSINDSQWLQIDAPGNLNLATTHTYSKQTITGTGTITGNIIANGSTIIKPGNTTDNTLSAIADAGDLTGKLTVNGNLSLHTSLDPDTPRAIFQLGGTNSHTSNPLLSSNITAFSTASSDNLYDSINVNGTLGLEAGTKLKIDLLTGYNPIFGDVFNLLDWSNLNPNINGAGLFTATDLILPTLSNDWFFATDHFTTHGIIYVVPEPSKATLCTLALALLLTRRQRNKNQLKGTT